ncbi:hypothetical protein ERHA54_42890 [Erwinia rhapontici]|uniref:phage tail protein n=1 Tax=Erwinia rhapontici TaxID=55212 RepID=UPI001BB36A8E|nr:phage tail protein [Erwinia rhapontici]BCQ41686.1 hypothetical protein ERHA54_42890 [Erwinia rhapontici]
MTTKYYALLTEIGAAKLANATATGTTLQLTQMAVGDGGCTLPTPGAKQTTLVGEKRRAPLNSLSVDPANNSQIVAEQIIPENEGGYWIREVGLFDADNALIAVANCPETYKPQLQEGSGRTQTVRMILVVSSTEAVTLNIDPSIVLATRKYVDDQSIEVKAYVDAGLAGKMDKAKNGADIANVAAFINNLGLGDAVLAAKYGSPLIGSLTYWPLELMPNEIWSEMKMEFIPYMGQSFDGVKYPLLSKLHPKNKLPMDMRDEFVRGWDNGRGGDSGRELMSGQGDAMRNFTATLEQVGGYSLFWTGTPAVSGAFKCDLINSSFSNSEVKAGMRPRKLTLDPSMVVPTALENRPRNVAWNMIVRAK